jgi:hypothetical protein
MESTDITHALAYILLIELVCLGFQNDVPESPNRRYYHQQHSENNADLKNT